jgi:(p)ppGpp synthase/HD superfamily hydrolase
MTDKLRLALEYADKKHEGQVRKYTGQPYIIHPMEVMSIVATVDHDENMLCAALLHDVVEDTAATITDIVRLFGEDVGMMVESLTDISKQPDGNRAARKAIDRIHSAQGSARSKTIKLADLISNTADIVENDSNFAKVYLKEKDLLMNFLEDGDSELFERAKGQIAAPIPT